MTFDAVDVIRAKRDGVELTGEQIDWAVDAYTRGAIAEEQMAALAMAILLNGMTRREVARWTDAMIRSGERMDWSKLDRPTTDKHSTGGVGDKITLPLAPTVAACGAAVPQLSGRGLGHTGGTLDKLESIPGWRASLSNEEMLGVLGKAGAVVCAAGSGLAPADRKLYGIRDATGSVEAIPLIVSSILSKKLAAGLGGLVMDVKHGNGAFMTELDDARALARALVDVAVAAGLPTVALLTDMNSVLGASAGNALEVRESIKVLRNDPDADPRLVHVTLELTRALLDLGGLADVDPEAVLRSGAAAERFGAMVAALGGPSDIMDNYDAHLDAAPVVREVFPSEDGVVTGHDTRALGIAVMNLGGGRAVETDVIDMAVGLDAVAPPGAAVARGARPLAIVHARDDAGADAAEAAVRAAITVGDAADGRADITPIVAEVLR